MTFMVNNSPLAGTEGDKVTSRMIRDRLLREAEGNVALRVTESDDKDSMEVSGRGELQLAILIETMRREGFELAVSRPRVVMQRDENGDLLEPIEEVIIDVDDEHPHPATAIGGRGQLRQHRIETGARPVRALARMPDADDVAELAVTSAATTGPLRSVTMKPAESVPTVEAEVYDGSGRVVLVWLGRRHIQGIVPGRVLTATGRVNTVDGRRTIYNPRYSLRAMAAGE